MNIIAASLVCLIAYLLDTRAMKIKARHRIDKIREAWERVYPGLEWGAIKVLPEPAWVLPRELVKRLQKLQYDNGEYVWQPGLTPDSPNTIFGHAYDLDGG